MGVERTIAMLQGCSTVFETELFTPILAVIEDSAGKRMSSDDETSRAFRVISDHMRSSVLILGDERGVAPGNLGQGYVLRRLIRRSVRYAKKLGLDVGFTKPLVDAVIDSYAHVYPELGEKRDYIVNELVGEEEKFEKTLTKGMSELDKVVTRMKEHNQTLLSGRMAFRLYDTCGFPLEFTEEICVEHGFTVDRKGYDKAFEKHKLVSRQGADKAFKGGLGDTGEATTRLHTATHLLHRSLQIVLGDHVQQKGSNITAERLRFDFSHPAKMTPEERERVEELVNEVIGKDIPLTMAVMTLEEAKAAGATALFAGKYGEQVKVYSVADFSKEVCGGPHAERTGELGHFRIKKEESSSSGVRRIRAVLEPVSKNGDA